MGAEPPAARGQWSSGGKASAAGGKGAGGGASSVQRFLQFLSKNNTFSGIFRLKFLL